MKRVLFYLTMILPAMLASCDHKDLVADDRQGDVRVVFDWRNAPDATPASMAAYFYDTSDGASLRYIFQDMKGGMIEIPVGNYSALGMNSDNTDWARVRSTDDPDGFETYTDDAENLEVYGLSTRTIPRAEGTEHERIAKTPGMLWADRTDNIALTHSGAEQVVTFYPEEVVCHYTVDITDVTNLEYVDRSEIDGTISGMSEGYRHGSSTPADEHVTMPFVLTGDTAEQSLHGEFLTFGESASQPGKHILTIYLYLKDGSRWYYTFDVTDQVHNAPDPRHVHIQLRGLPLPKPIVVGGGIQPDVSDWQTENIDLIM